MKLPEIERRLLKIFDEVGTPLPANELAGMVELVKAGEPGIGLENFCTQLFEYDIKVSVAVVEEMAMLGTVMGIRPRYWERLERG